ncbi:uncharacterized protein LOC125670813 isoform X2 [Ostrea edulis]|uniref:uncharacterized protein LOC125670813 isoform X2 n=1 Tax=Ostrea edulis TaxID=37623 RepID=UPI0024AFA275|nr:uncharacterized protein LOC125670813 isoform X2 [Ostrea edulis]
MVWKFVSAYLCILGPFPSELQSFSNREEIGNVLCGYTARLEASWNSNCTGTINITIRLPSGFWEAMKNTHYTEALFEVDNGSIPNPAWNFNCFPKDSGKCFKEIQLVHPIRNGEFGITLKPNRTYYGCTIVQRKERCFLKPDTSTTVENPKPDTLTTVIIPTPPETPLWWFIIIICMLLSPVALGVIFLLHRKLKYQRLHVNTDLKVLVLDLSENSGHPSTEVQPLTTCTSFTASFKRQLEDRCRLTVVNSQNPEYSYLNNDDYDALIHSNDAFIIIPSVRMTPTGEDEELQMDVQVTVNILRHLQYCRDRCVFVCCTNHGDAHLTLKENYTHFRHTPIYKFELRNLTSLRNQNILTDLLQYLLDKVSEFRPMNNI